MKQTALMTPINTQVTAGADLRTSSVAYSFPRGVHIKIITHGSTHFTIEEKMKTIVKPASIDGWTKRLPRKFVSLIEVKHQDFVVISEPVEDGCFMAKTSSPKFNAIGQGDTEEEAVRDLREAIVALQEATD
jgi:predicted RNase H-like HicB family nuclease